MINRLEAIAKRYEEISNELSKEEVIKDIKKMTELSKEQRRLSQTVEIYEKYKTVLSDIETAKEMLNDKEMVDFAKEEISSLTKEKEAIEKELEILLLPHDPNDEKNVIVEIRAGAGGEEAALFASTLFRMYSMFAVENGFRIESVGSNETELGGYREISFMIEGDGAYSRFKYESGVHRVQRVPDTESQGRIHTSTVTVAVLPEAEVIELDINPSDIVVETMKSSGAGGQHVNKTESAVRLIHKPSGMVIECREERSQYKNRDKAMKLLRSRLLDKMRSEQEGKVAQERRLQVGTADRSEKIRTYNYPQSRVTDHKIGYTTHTLQSFLNGNNSAMNDALAAADTAEKLKNSGEN